MWKEILNKVHLRINKNKKTLAIGLIFILLLSFIGFISYIRHNNKESFPPLQKETVLIPDSYVPDQIVVGFKKEYDLTLLEKEIEIREQTRKKTLGAVRISVQDALSILVNKKNPETKQKDLLDKLTNAGVVSIERGYIPQDPNQKKFYLLKLKKNSDIKKMLKALSGFIEVESYDANYIVVPFETPDDPYYPQLWGIQKIEIPNAWNTTKGSSSVKVAVIDTGIDYSHQDLAGQVVKGRDFINNDDDPMDDIGHGTHVAGTIGALTNNNVGVAGINWSVSLMAIKVLGPSGGSSFAVANGINYAVDNGIQVINMSLGSKQPNSCPSNQAQALNYARNKKVVVVVAAGNRPPDNAANYTMTSCKNSNPDMIVVAATTQSDTKASFSKYGTAVDIAAPGSGILSTIPGDRYGSKDGTSMASPHVAGVAALLISACSGLTPQQVKDYLVNGADPILSTDQPIGPRLNAFKALTLCTGGSLPINSPTPVVTNVPSAHSISINIWIDNNNDGVRDGSDTDYQGAIVNLTGPINLSEVTDSSGNLVFSNLPTGGYSIGLIIPGYNISPYPISITNNDILLTLRLSPGAPLSAPVVITQPITLSPTTAPTPTNAPLPTGGGSGGSPTPTPTPIATYNCEVDQDCIRKTGQKNLQFCPMICTPQ